MPNVLGIDIPASPHPYVLIELLSADPVEKDSDEVDFGFMLEIGNGVTPEIAVDVIKMLADNPDKITFEQ